jgi:hypothetical protein
VFADAKGIYKLGNFTTATIAGSTFRMRPPNPYVLPPEHDQNTGQLEIKKDIWSIGVLAHVALFREYPFHNGA